MISKLQGQSDDYLATLLIPSINFTTYGLYDIQNKKFSSSFDLNTTLFFVINGGIDYKNVTYLHSKKISGYAGLGFHELAQIQGGFSADGFSLRFRSDIRTSLFGKYKLYSPIRFSAIAETYCNNPKMKWFIGVGVGIAIFPGIIHSK